MDYRLQTTLETLAEKMESVDRQLHSLQTNPQHSLPTASHKGEKATFVEENQQYLSSLNENEVWITIT